MNDIEINEFYISDDEDEKLLRRGHVKQEKINGDVLQSPKKRNRMYHSNNHKNEYENEDNDYDEDEYSTEILLDNATTSFKSYMNKHVKYKHGNWITYHEQ